MENRAKLVSLRERYKKLMAKSPSEEVLGETLEFLEDLRVFVSECELTDDQDVILSGYQADINQLLQKCQKQTTSEVA